LSRNDFLFFQETTHDFGGWMVNLISEINQSELMTSQVFYLKYPFDCVSYSGICRNCPNSPWLWLMLSYFKRSKCSSGVKVTFGCLSLKVNFVSHLVSHLSLSQRTSLGLVSIVLLLIVQILFLPPFTLVHFLHILALFLSYLLQDILTG